MKKVVKGVYETDKMKVEIGANTVSKTFKIKGNYKRRYERERTALQRLSGNLYFPQLIDFDDSKKCIKMSRLGGENPEQLSVKHIELLRTMVLTMHNSGVARHAIPIRDLLSKNEQELGMVDFERVTLRHFRLSPIWLIAQRVSNYHLYRLISTHQPHLLSPAESKFFIRINKIRDPLKVLRQIKDRLRRLF